MKLMYTGFEGPWSNSTTSERLTGSGTTGDVYEWLIANKLHQNAIDEIIQMSTTTQRGMFYDSAARTKNNESGLGTSWATSTTNGSNTLGSLIFNTTTNLASGFGANYWTMSSQVSESNTTFCSITIGSSAFSFKFAGTTTEAILQQNSPISRTLDTSSTFSEAVQDNQWYNVNMEVLTSGYIEFTFNGFTVSYNLGIHVGKDADMTALSLNGIYVLGTDGVGYIDDVAINNNDDSDGLGDVGKPKAHRFYNLTTMLSADALNGQGQVRDLSNDNWESNFTGTAFDALTDFNDATFAKAGVVGASQKFDLPIYESTATDAASGFQNRLAVLRTNLKNIRSLDNRTLAVVLSTNQFALTGQYNSPFVQSEMRSTTYYTKSAGTEFTLSDLNNMIAEIKYVK